MVEARATAKFVRGSSQKAKLVIDLIRGKRAAEALSILQNTNKRVCRPLEKVLRSAIANAQQKAVEEAKRIDESSSSSRPAIASENDASSLRQLAT